MAQQKISFFGRLADQMGRSRNVDMPETALKISELRLLLSAQETEFTDIMADPCIRACVDGAIVTDDALVRAGQEIAFIPPLSGG